VKRASLLAALVLLAGSFQISRPGYSVDEEFTEFAVRGIHAHGLPLLPSGLLYDRGLAYSYASAMVNGRVISLACAALALVLAFALVRRHAGTTAATMASILAATSLPFWAAATTARFYAPFLAAYLAVLLCLNGNVFVLAGLAVLARLLHELAFTLIAVPVLCAIVARGERRRWLIATAAITAGLVAGQLVLFALHALEPSSGETMVRRFFLWQVLNLFEVPGDRQFAIPLVVMVIAWVAAPKDAWLATVLGLSGAAMILAFSIARATNSAPLSVELVQAVLVEGSRYPLDMFWHIARTTPLTLVLVLATLVTRMARAEEWRPFERAMHGLWIGWVMWFGVIDSGITTNYLLLPVSFMLIAIAVDLVAIGRVKTRTYMTVTLAVVVFALALDQWRGEGSVVTRLEAARPTINVAGIADIRAGLHPNDRVVCTDELGCLMLVGRIDRWLALDDFVRERFLVRRANDALTGVYTGVPAVFRPADLFSPNADGTLPDRVIVVDIFKDYPIGNSRFWLPKAIEEDGLVVLPLLETAQARVLLLSPPERVATARGDASRERR
jgi:hypothetical protein